MSILSLYKNLTGREPTSVVPLAAAGSNRRYFRLEGPVTVVGCEGDDLAENRAFLYLTRHFLDAALPVPKLLAAASDDSCYLLEDLGDVSLYDSLYTGRTTGIYSPQDVKLLEETVATLPLFQFRGAEGLDFSRCYPQAEMDGRMVMWDLNYFKYCFLKAAGVEFDEAALQDDFDSLCAELLKAAPKGFMYRDFQTRNVMIKDTRPRFIDYQGGRSGPVHYDVASMLWQPRAALPAELRSRLVDVYLDSAAKYATIDRDEFLSTLRVFVLFRTLQVLGAYGFRGLMEKKSRFVESIPLALKQLAGLVTDKVISPWPTLEEACRRLVALPRFSHHEKGEGLRVRVCSFSYRRGIPDDLSGNGGGFVFDCRAIHNPGRYDRYKALTGLDVDVIEFLENDGEVTTFLHNVYGLVDASVKRYLRRGFTDLMISFGCTGGRHRSVYCAEHTARHIHERFNVEVVLEHREQGLNETLLPHL